MLSAIKITLLSDTTVASTTGFGSLVDTEVDHDPSSGLPRIGGKVLHGLLQDSWLAMADYYPEFAEAARRVLGVEGSHTDTAIVHIGSAQPPVEQHVKDMVSRSDKLTARGVLNALSTVRSQTSIDRKTGAASEGTLRSSRAVTRGLMFFAPLTWFETPSEDDFKVLDLCLKATRHLGLRRNRGRGYVRLEVCDVTLANEEAPYSRNQKINETAQIAYLPFQFSLQTPLLVSQPGGDPNSVESLSSIPGSVFRGALAARLSENEIADYVLGDQIYFLNAYPQIGGNERSLPARHSWREEKDNSRKDNDYFDALDLAAHAGTWPSEQVKTFSLEFTRADGSSGSNVKKDLSLHHRRDRTRGRATEGNIFAYESISEGQTFEGVLRIKGQNKADLETIAGKIKNLFAKPITLGRSRRAEYGGLTQLYFHKLHEHEVPLMLGDLKQGDSIQLVLTSDYVGRSGLTGQYDPHAIEENLKKFLPQLNIKQRFYHYRLVGGYNRKWQTELPQAKALKAGSVMVLELTQDCPLSQWKDVLDEGLGERRQEGFGRFQLYPHSLNQNLRPFASRPDKSVIEIADQPDVVTWFNQRLLQQRLLQILDTRIADDLTTIKLKASSSLLGRLREALRKGDLKTELDGLAAKAANDLKDSRVTLMTRRGAVQKSVLNLLKELSDTNSGDAVASLLDIEGAQQDLGLDGVQTDARLLNTLTCFAVLDLLMKKAKLKREVNHG